jgi:hypothetical protein
LQPAATNVTALFEILSLQLGVTDLEEHGIAPDEFIDRSPDKFAVLAILDRLYARFKNHELTDVDFDTSFEVSIEHHHRNANPIKRKMPRTSQDDATISKLKPPEYNPAAKRGSLKDGLFKNKIEFFNNNDSNSYSNNNIANGERKLTPPFMRNSSSSGGQSDFKSSISQTTSTCYLCAKKVFLMERLNVMNFFMHSNCFKCTQCQVLLKNGAYNHHRNPNTGKYMFYCSLHNHRENSTTPSFQAPSSSSIWQTSQFMVFRFFTFLSSEIYFTAD